MFSIIIFVIALLGFATFIFGNVTNKVVATFPKLTSGQARWTGFIVGALALSVSFNIFVAIAVGGLALYFKGRR